MEHYEEEEEQERPQTEEVENEEIENGAENENEVENENEEDPAMEEEIKQKVLENLHIRAKQLELENSRLKDDIQKINTYSHQGALEYYVSLRKDLFLKIEENNKKIKNFEKMQHNENKDIEKQLKYLESQLNEATELNKILKEQHQSILEEIENKKNQLKEDNNVQLTNLPNHSRIEELEYQINAINADITKKTYLIKDQKETIEELQEKLNNQTKELNEKLEKSKNQYYGLLGESEISEDNLDKVFNEKTEEFKKDMQKNIYQLSKKVLASKIEENKKYFEIFHGKTGYEKDLNNKNEEIKKYKNDIKDIQTNYELLFKLCTDQLNKFNNNSSKFKNAYFNREKDFIKICNYYIDMLNQYNKPLLDNENPKNKIESEYHINVSKVIELQKKAESLINKINEIKQKREEKNQLVKKQITDGISNIDNKVKNIDTKQKDLSQKIKKFSEFYNEVCKKQKKIDNLSKENKNLFNKNKDLISQLNKYLSNINNQNDIEDLKLKINKIEQDFLYKDEALKNYEEMFREDSEMEEQDEVRDDVLKRLKLQVTGLKSQIEKLILTKTHMDNYYSKEIDTLKNKLNLLINENIELKNFSENTEIETITKQQNAVDLWLQEFKEFKECYNSPNDIQNLIKKFCLTMENLKNISDYKNEIELKKLTSEVHLKEKQLKTIKENKELENSKNKKKIENVQKQIFEKVKLYDDLANKRDLLITDIGNSTNDTKKINEKKNNDNENELNGISEQKMIIQKIIDENNNLKLPLFSGLRNKIKELENQVKDKSENYLNSIKEIKETSDEQLKIIKDREDYITKQTDIVSNNLKSVANQNERAVSALRQENQQIKDKNYTLSKKLMK